MYRPRRRTIATTLLYEFLRRNSQSQHIFLKLTAAVWLGIQFKCVSRSHSFCVYVHVKRARRRGELTAPHHRPLSIRGNFRDIETRPQGDEREWRREKLKKSPSSTKGFIQLLFGRWGRKGKCRKHGGKDISPLRAFSKRNINTPVVLFNNGSEIHCTVLCFGEL